MYRDFIDQARKKQMFCPHLNHNIPRLQCVNPPSKPVLVKLFTDAVHKGIRTKDPFVLENRPGLENLIKVLQQKVKWPEKDWLILLLAKVPGKSCPIFQRDYEPPAPGQVKREAKPVPLFNDDGFWDGLGKVSQPQA